jgi:hypothetical protein
MRFASVVSLIPILFVACGIRAGRAPEQPDAAASQIKTTFESQLSNLRPETQYHYALRMYRITGDSSYIVYIAPAVLTQRSQLLADLEGLKDSSYLDSRREVLFEELGEGNRKSRVRRDLFKSRGNLILDLAILSNCYKLFDHAGEAADSDSLISRAVAYLRTVDFGLLAHDSRVMADYSAQAANAVYYLYFLDIVDLRREFEKSLRGEFPDVADKRLSDLEFSDKVYGLTHIMIAGSGYYQQPVDPTEFEWILKYFESRKKRIFEETKPDVVAEVGLCYLLAGKRSDPMVRACRDQIVRYYDPVAGMVPSPSGSVDLETGEHRNILAIMLLAWPERLHPGPILPVQPSVTPK